MKSNLIKNSQGVPQLAGLQLHTCADANSGANKGDPNYCKPWYKDQRWWEQVAIVFLSIALIVEVIAFVSTFFTFFFFCDTPVSNIMLPVLSLIAATFLFLAVASYAINGIVKMVAATNDWNYEAAKLLNQGMKELSNGYNFYTVVLASIQGVAATIVGSAVINAYNREYNEIMARRALSELPKVITL
ncbi:unnamed protein product [Toxocara canis]|uniref:MARVEL domain-containing protein n=1 Tax=Toxocara canis TaxID=6265 RepID=A0A183UQ59_TOXCA|nr:unnamed protein product [Toxocara canis]